MATVLTLHRGGRDPVERVRVEERAQRALRELADALPPGDRLGQVAHELSQALLLRGIGRTLDPPTQERTGGDA